MPMSRRTARSPRVAVATLLLMTAAPGFAMARIQDDGVLAQLIEHSQRVLSGPTDTTAWRSEAQAWLDRLRLALQAHPDAPQVPAAMMQIGEILERQSEREAAIAEYARVGASPEEFGWRLEGLRRCVRLASALDDEPHRALAFLDDFEEGVTGALQQGRVLWDHHLRMFEGRRTIRANVLAAAAARIGNRAHSPADVQIAGLYLRQAGDLLDAWITERGQFEHPTAVASERIRGASYYIEAAAMLARSGDSGASGGARVAASQLLEYAMIDPWSEGRQHYAAALQLKNLFATHGAHDAFLLEASRVLAVAVPGHEALSYLRELGDSVSGNPRTLHFADDLFELVADTEKRWFPEEYRRHVNYQWSRVEQGMIALAFGDADRARRVADELGTLPLDGEYFRGRRDHIRKSVDRRDAPQPVPAGGGEETRAHGSVGSLSDHPSQQAEGLPRDGQGTRAEATPDQGKPPTHAAALGRETVRGLADGTDQTGAGQSPRPWPEAVEWGVSMLVLGPSAMVVCVLLLIRLRRSAA